MGPNLLNLKKFDQGVVQEYYSPVKPYQQFYKIIYLAGNNHY